MNNTELVSQLREERELMMSHWRDTENGLVRNILVLFSSIAGFTFFYFEGEWKSLSIPRDWILLIIIQAAFLSFILAVSIFGAVCTYIGYICAIEKRINELSSNPTAIWVSSVWMKLTAMPWGSFFWCWVIIDTAVIAGLFGAMITFIMTVTVFWMKLLTIFELPIGLILIIWARIDLNRSEKLSQDLLHKKPSAS